MNLVMMYGAKSHPSVRNEQILAPAPFVMHLRRRVDAVPDTGHPFVGADFTDCDVAQELATELRIGVIEPLLLQ